MKKQTRQSIRCIVLALIFVLETAPVALAELINISAVTFTPRASSTSGCQPGTFTEALGEEFQGLLLNAGATYFANADLPHGKKIKKFTLHYRDFDADEDVVARLMAKRFTTSSAFDPPLVLAEVASSGADDALRSASTTEISNAKINLMEFYYYVEVSLGTNFCGSPMEVVGVQLEVGWR